MKSSSIPDAPESVVERSWRRCAEQGLNPGQLVAEVVASRGALSDSLEANARLLTFAQPIIENLHRQIARSSSMVLLADNKGMVLRAVGDGDFVSRASRVALSPGAVWSERHMGTNAIGTALHEGSSVAVLGDQHYLERNSFLTCIATPIHAPAGGILGILDISSDARVSHTHARALLRTTADIIENRLIETLSGSALVLRLHPVAEALGTPLEGLAVFAEDGALIGCNRRAAELAEVAQPAGRAYAHWFTMAWPRVLSHAMSGAGQPLVLQSVRGRTLFALATPGSVVQRPNRHATSNAPRPTADARGPALAALCTGDKRIADAVRRAQRIVDHDIPLLIQGETGTGKEVFAQAFHRSGKRGEGPFVAVNCASIPAALIEAELFGYIAGAYTGARSQGSRGKLREAHRGTLFLDEIGDMPLSLQAVLLRVLETRRVAPLGGGAEEDIDVALVCASHRPLRDLVAQGLFRADLLFRLSGMTVSLPPLRERGDLGTLVRRILSEEAGRPDVQLAPASLAVLQRQPWPGNLRQLRYALRLAVALLGDSSHTLLPEHLPQELLLEAETGCPASGLRAAEIRLIREALMRNGGNISATARELGITRTTLYRKLRAAREDS